MSRIIIMDNFAKKVPHLNVKITVASEIRDVHVLLLNNRMFSLVFVCLFFGHQTRKRTNVARNKRNITFAYTRGRLNSKANAHKKAATPDFV